MNKRSKKVKRSHKKTRRMRGGSYGFGGPLAPGAVDWKAGSEYGPTKTFADRGGNGPQYGRGRSRGRKHKGGTHCKTMRGGGKYGGVSASFEGRGYRGMGNVSQSNTKGPAVGPNVSKFGAFNDNGAKGFGSFGGLLPK